MTYSDIKNEAEWSAETKGINLNIPSKGNTNEDRKANGQKPNPDEGATPNFAGSEGEDSSTTKSAIALGEIEIRSDEDKEEKDKTDLADLSRDPDKANNPLDKIFDKDKILEKQEAAALFGEIGFHLAGDLAEKMDWKEGSAEKILLHGLIAGLMAEINGGKFGEGLTTGAINEMIIGVIADHQKDLGLTGADARWLSALIGGAVSEGMGGSVGQGAGIADSATKNNFVDHFVNMNEMMILFSISTVGVYLILDESGKEIGRVIDGIIIPSGDSSGMVIVQTAEGTMSIQIEYAQIYDTTGNFVGEIGDNILYQKKGEDKQIKDAGREAGLTPEQVRQWRKEMEKGKSKEGRGGADNYSYPELVNDAIEWGITNGLLGGD